MPEMSERKWENVGLKKPRENTLKIKAWRWCQILPEEGDERGETCTGFPTEAEALFQMSHVEEECEVKRRRPKAKALFSVMLISEGKERVVGNPGSGHGFEREMFDKRHSHAYAEVRTLREETWQRCMKSSPAGGAQVGG